MRARLYSLLLFLDSITWPPPWAVIQLVEAQRGGSHQRISLQNHCLQGWVIYVKVKVNLILSIFLVLLITVYDFFLGQDTDEYKYVGSELKHLVDQMKTLMSERKQKQAEKASHHRRSRSNQNGYNRYDDLVFSEIRAERRCFSF